MNYEMIIHYASIVMMAVAVLVFVTNIIVEVYKNLFPNLPTNILAVIVAVAVTGLAAAILLSQLKIPFFWYYIPLALVLGLFVAYAAMFGFDKFKEAFDKLKKYKE